MQITMRIIKISVLIFFTLSAMLGLGVARALAHGSDETPYQLPDAGLTPENRFYFLDRLGEALREFFTFDPEEKTRLHLSLAVERIAEIKAVLESRGVDAEGLDVAQRRLQEHLARATSLFENQKRQGRDVGALARKFRGDFEAPKNALLHLFEQEGERLETMAENLEARLRAAERASDFDNTETHSSELRKTEVRLEMLERSMKSIENALEKEEDRLEKLFGARDEASIKIEKAEKERLEILRGALEDGVALPGDIFEEFDDLLDEAKTLFGTGDFGEAGQLAKEAKENLEDVEEIVEMFEEALDDEEKLLDGVDDGTGNNGGAGEQGEQDQQSQGEPRDAELKALERDTLGEERLLGEDIEGAFGDLRGMETELR